MSFTHDMPLMSLRALLLCGFLWLFIALRVGAQETIESDIVQLADKFFLKKDYRAALPLYQKAEYRFVADPFLKYKIGICYYHSTNQKHKAIPYFEYAFKYKNSQVPPEIYYYLGKVYHYKGDYVAALQEFQDYQNAIRNTDKPIFTDAIRMAEICYNGIELSKQFNKDISVDVVPFPINTSYDDYAPLVTTKNEMLMLSSNRLKESVNLVYGDDYVYLPDNLISTSEDVFTAFRKGIGWSFPYGQGMGGKKIITYSLSGDGTSLLLFIGENADKGDIYISRFKNSRWSQPKKLKINEKYRTRGACFAKGGREIYFSSDREGGFGGFDIYLTTLNEKEQWTEPQNLGPIINSLYDEVTPFMAFDNKTLYFSSDGHNTIGGLDIFTSKFGKGAWSKPENLGMPINSPFDDAYFTSVPNGKYSYFASNRADQTAVGGWDILSIFRPEKKVPYAMVRGTIIAKREGVNIPTKLKVTDIQTNTVQKYIYNPDIDSGKYFMILPYNKSYSVQIEMENNITHTVELDLPQEAYNYEMHQLINITPIKIAGNTIGDEIRVEKAEYKITKRSEMPIGEQSKDIRYDALVFLMERIVDYTELEGLNTIQELEKNISKNEEHKPDDYYTPLIDMVENAIAQADVKTLLSLDRPRADEPIRTVFYKKTPQKNGKYQLISHKMVFKRNSEAVSYNSLKEIQEFIDLVEANPTLSLELVWFAPDNSTSQDEYTKSKIEDIISFMKNKSFDTQKVTISRGISENYNATTNQITIEVRISQDN
jgi:hypothetical protein